MTISAVWRIPLKSTVYSAQNNVDVNIMNLPGLGIVVSDQCGLCFSTSPVAADDAVIGRQYYTHVQTNVQYTMFNA